MSGPPKAIGYQILCYNATKYKCGFLLETLNYTFYLKATYFLASSLGKNHNKKKPFLHNYFGATFPSPCFGLFLAVALQFSVINTDKEIWRCRIKERNLY